MLPSSPLQAAPSVHKPDWQALRLLNQYRLLLLLALAAVYYLSTDERTLGSRDDLLFQVVHLAYLVCTLAFVYLVRVRIPAVDVQFFLQNYLDILFIAGLMYASGGVQSGLGPLLIINLALWSQLSSVRHALLFAAIATMIIIGEELISQLRLGAEGADFDATAVLGTLMMATAWVMTVPFRRLTNRQMAAPSHSRVALDVNQVTQLNEEIIRELDSGVLVVDAYDTVLLINDTARTMLAAEFTPIPVNLQKLCAELAQNLKTSTTQPNAEIRPIAIIATGLSVLMQHIPLSNGGKLIKIDDHAHIRQQFQQLKLASLGRLSASIAHEIRNPLGAIAHAVQLLEESDSLKQSDRELLSIAYRQTGRINRIVQDVLQLSNHEQVHAETVRLDTQLALFAERYRSENRLDDKSLEVVAEPIMAIIDPGHLDQMLWNLCTNAQLHNTANALKIQIWGWQSPRGATIDVIDNGHGISDMDREKLFEPFYSTHHAGTGLGLYIISALCSLNQAQIECLPCDTGAHFRIVLLGVQDMAA